MYEINYTVERRGQQRTFPIDMLRYDSSFPTNESDSNAIQSGLRTVRLTKRWMDRNWKPSSKRWESYGWKVVQVDEVKKR